MPAVPLPTASATLGARVRALETLYRQIADTRMRGVPVLHAGLAVQAVGFAADEEKDAGEPGDPGEVAPLAVGVLVTPWFMNLLRLPLQPLPGGRGWLEVGRKGQRRIGATAFEFIGAHEPGFGVHEACSLFSPMFQFADQAAAVATAREVLDLLRAPSTPAAAPPIRSEALAEAAASRRGFLFGRRPQAGGQ